MQATRQALKQDIKQEVLAEIQRRNHAGYPDGYMYQPQSSYYADYYPLSRPYNSGLSRPEVDRIKREVLQDLEDEMQEYPHPVPRPRTYPGSIPGWSSHDRNIIESIKTELLSEMEGMRSARMADTYGYGQILSDRKLNRMIDQRYNSLDNVRSDIRKELDQIRKMESRRSPNPYIRDIAQSIAMEAREQGVPLEQVMQNLNTNSAGTGLWGRMIGSLNTGQRRGFLYGLGAALLAYLVWPSARNNLHSVAVRSLEEGMSLADRARSFVSRTKDSADPELHDSGDKDQPEIDLLQ